MEVINKVLCTASNSCDYMIIRNQLKEIGIEAIYVDCSELETTTHNIEVVSNEKARQLFNKTQLPILVIESGYIYGKTSKELSYPLMKAIVPDNKTDLEESLNDNEKCCLVNLLTYYDGINFSKFYSVNKGYILKNKNCNNENCIKDFFVPEQSDLITICDYTQQELEEQSLLEPNIEFVNWLNRSKKLTYKQN